MRKKETPERALIGWQPQRSHAGALQASAAARAGCLRHFPQLGRLHPSQAKLSSHSSRLYMRWNGTGGVRTQPATRQRQCASVAPCLGRAQRHKCPF